METFMRSINLAKLSRDTGNERCGRLLQVFHIRKTVKFLLATLALMIAGASTAQAAPSISTVPCGFSILPGPCAYGVQNLEVDAKAYDVVFVRGFYPDLFPTQESREALTFWNDVNGAQSARQALSNLFTQEGIYALKVDGSDTIATSGAVVMYGADETNFLFSLFLSDWSMLPNFGGWSSSLGEFTIEGGGLFAFFTLVSAEDLLTDLMIVVANLNLDMGMDNSLDSKLQNALDRTQSGDVPSALGIMHAFILSIDAQRGKKLTEMQADELIAAAQEIISALEEP